MRIHKVEHKLKLPTPSQYDDVRRTSYQWKAGKERVQVRQTVTINEMDM